MQNSHLACHSEFTGLPQRFGSDGIVNARIDLIAHQQYHGDQLHPDHEGNEHADGTIHLVVSAEVGNVVGESIRNTEAQQCGDE